MNVTALIYMTHLWCHAVIMMGGDCQVFEIHLGDILQNV